MYVTKPGTWVSQHIYLKINGRVYSAGKNFTGKITPDVILPVFNLNFTVRINPALILPVKPKFYR